MERVEDVAIPLSAVFSVVVVGVVEEVWVRVGRRVNSEEGEALSVVA